MTTMRQIQQRLQALGHDPGPADNVGGPRTAAAMEAFLRTQGLPMTVTATRTELRATGPAQPFPGTARPPWVEKGLEVFGLHEKRDNARLRAWLLSDGHTLGDPAQLPWCGDYVETCIRLSLPDEPLRAALGQNPYWARNWMIFGRGLVDPCLWSVVVFARGAGGHVGFAVAQDDTHLHVLGGNQGDAVSIVRIQKSRLLAARWPLTTGWPQDPLPHRAPGDIPASVNEV